MFLKSTISKILPILWSMAAISACSGKPLNGEGRVKAWTMGPDDTIAAAAASIRGLELEASPGGIPWRQQLGRADGPDLVLAEFGLDTGKAVETKALLDLTAYRERLGNAGRLWPGFRDELFRENLGGRFFLPATVYLWGLWYNKEVLENSGISPPDTIGELESAFKVLIPRQVIPLALGSESGWPALALLSLLDLRFNGAEAYAKLLDGSRQFDDPTLLAVYATLAKWRNQGWLDPESGRTGWAEALAKVENAQAAFLFMSAYAEGRARNREKLGFIGFPVKDADKKWGELAVIEGFTVSAASRAPEAALSLADAYIGTWKASGTDAGFRMSAVSETAGSGKAPTPVLATQALMLKGAKALLPQLDTFLPTAASMELNRTMIRFLSEGSKMDPIGLAEALGKAGDVQ